MAAESFTLWNARLLFMLSAQVEQNVLEMF